MSELEKRDQSPARPSTSGVRRLLIGIPLILVGIAVVIAGAYYFDQYTESKAFCGLLCHPNQPEYFAQKVSPHGDVECGTCHIGPGLLPKVAAKIYGVGELYALVTNTYERPIAKPVSRLRPASEICEQCHTPDQPYPDRVRRIATFAADEQNTVTRTYLTLKLDRRDEQNVHWHISNPVWFVALDVAEQQIPWAAVMKDGQLVSYVAKDSAVPASELETMPRQEMDCMDCHNRATHIFRNPERLVDQSMGAGQIDPSLPYVKREASRLLSASYPTQDEGAQAMTGLSDFYRSQYPSVFSQKQQAIDQAVSALQEIYRQTVFPAMNVTWQAYANNVGHTDFPGCFRCHDDQHVTSDGTPITLNCDTCHSTPLVTTAAEPALNETAALNAITQAEPQPDSHRAPDFIQSHRILANDSCAECHGPIEFGTDDSNFCANSACHEQQWPDVNLMAFFQHPVPLAGPHAEATCNACHQGVKEPNLADCAECHNPPSTPHFGSDCADCHTIAGWERSAAAWVTGVAPIPHRVTGVTDCLQCHGQGQLVPEPANHANFVDTTCVQCHGTAPRTDIPTIPHVVEGRDACLTCHGEEELAPVPTDHQGWPNSTCLLCHQAAP